MPLRPLSGSYTQSPSPPIPQSESRTGRLGDRETGSEQPERLSFLSVIVPIRNEKPEAAERLRGLCDGSSEILVADGGGPAETSRAFESTGARRIEVGGPRGRRLDLAARQAAGDILFFLHADCIPPQGALELIRETLGSGAQAGAFSLGYEEATPALRWIAWWANLRSRLFKLPFGDQGLFCRREAYERSGGYRDLPICDDVDLVLRLRRAGPFIVLREKMLTSPRRYRERGALRQVLTNWKVLAGYFAGVPAGKLERWYSGR